MQSVFWSAESEALHSAEHYGPLKTRLYHGAKHYGPLKARLKDHGQISNFCTFLLYLDYELLLRSLRSLCSNNHEDEDDHDAADDDEDYDDDDDDDDNKDK